jgi:hypothetical protein
MLSCHLRAQPCLLLLNLFYFNFDWPQILHEYSCKPKDFTDMLPRVEWKCNGMKTRGFRRWEWCHNRGNWFYMCLYRENIQKYSQEPLDQKNGIYLKALWHRTKVIVLGVGWGHNKGHFYIFCKPLISPPLNYIYSCFLCQGASDGM